MREKTYFFASFFLSVRESAYRCVTVPLTTSHVPILFFLVPYPTPPALHVTRSCLHAVWQNAQRGAQALGVEEIRERYNKEWNL